MDIPNKNMVQYEVQYVKATDDISKSMRESVQKSHQSDKQKQIHHNAVSSCVRKYKLTQNSSNVDVEQNKNKKQRISSKDCDYHKCIQTFRYKIYCGPLYICVICNRTLYKKSTKMFLEKSYPDIVHLINTGVRSVNG